jgi:aspartate aminotransferase
MNKMKAIISHLGAWSPKAEQIAAAAFLNKDEAVDTYLQGFRSRVEDRLNGFFKGFKTLKSLGYNVDAISPQAAMYLTVKIDLRGMRTKEGTELTSMEDVTEYLLNEAKVALVPFYAFGTERNSPWYRLSIGTASINDIDRFFENLQSALSELS